MKAKDKKKKPHPYKAMWSALNREKREALAGSCGVTYEHLRMLYSNRQPSVQLAIKLNQHTDLGLHELRPDVWAKKTEKVN